MPGDTPQTDGKPINSKQRIQRIFRAESVDRVGLFEQTMEYVHELLDEHSAAPL